LVIARVTDIWAGHILAARIFAGCILAGVCLEFRLVIDLP